METMNLVLIILLSLAVSQSCSEILHKRQKRTWIIDSFTIDEGYSGSYPYDLGTIEIEKDFNFFQIHGQGVDEDPVGILQVHREDGHITVHGPVDYERHPRLKVTFKAVNKKTQVLDTRLGIEIFILDANDHAPHFVVDDIKISKDESTKQDTDLLRIRAEDTDRGKNGEVDFRIVSIVPEPEDVIFFLKDAGSVKDRIISFYGCLDHEKADKYTIIIEAKDQGEKIQLSSSCTIQLNVEEGNNHLPTIRGVQGSGKVKEGEEDVLVLRLEGRDEDTKGTPAWRAKYEIQGDPDNNFQMVTDPQTNEGLLYVKKHLDYEKTPQKTLNISVKNEIAHHLCKVVARKTEGPWDLAIADGEAGTGSLPESTRTVTVTVEDVNEPPIFKPPYKEVTVLENIKAGHHLVSFTAEDPDIHANKFEYKKGQDPANWVTVDASTGKVTTIEGIDRESRYVKNNMYGVTILAVDNGKPQLTSTATLNVKIIDQNDNAPTLTVGSISMCQSDKASVANITALDLDDGIYGGPFHFRLLNDNVKGKWRLDPNYGYSVNLVKESTVYSAHYELMFQLLDAQGKAAIQNLTVTVCECPDPTTPSCHDRKSTGKKAAGPAMWILIFSMLLFAGMLLLALLLSCKKKHLQIPDEDAAQDLMKSNTETLGNDCKVAFDVLKQGHARNGGGTLTQTERVLQNTYQPSYRNITKSEIRTQAAAQPLGSSKQRTSKVIHQHQEDYLDLLISNSWMDASSAKRTRHSRHSEHERLMAMRSQIQTQLSKQLHILQAPQQEMGDYPPHVYAEVGEQVGSSDLDAISIPGDPLDLHLDPDTEYKFNTLARLCTAGKHAASSSGKQLQRAQNL